MYNLSFHGEKLNLLIWAIRLIFSDLVTFEICRTPVIQYHYSVLFIGAIHNKILDVSTKSNIGKITVGFVYSVIFAISNVIVG